VVDEYCEAERLFRRLLIVEIERLLQCSEKYFLNMEKPGMACKRRELGATGVEGSLNACLGFRREARVLCAATVTQRCAVFTEDVAKEGQLLFISLAESADPQMGTHAYSHVERQRPIHCV
jgi:hypothetical protein